jgi:hypothetical protein
MQPQIQTSMQPQIQQPLTQTLKSLDGHIHSIAEKIAEEKNKEQVKKDTHAIKKKLIETMSPSDNEDEEEEKSIKVKNTKQPSVNTKIDDLEHQNHITSSICKFVYIIVCIICIFAFDAKI